MGFNTILASVLTIFGKNSFLQNLIYSQWIGMSIWLLIDVGRHALHPLGHISAIQASLMTIVGGLIGYLFGSAMGDLTLGHELLSGWRHAPDAMAGYLTLSLLAAALLVTFSCHANCSKQKEQMPSKRGSKRRRLS